MMSKNIKNTIFSILAFLTLGLGISLQIKAGIGQSMLNAFALTLSELIGFNVGTTLNLLNLLFFILYLFVRKSHINHRDIIQLISIIANGYIINMFVYFIFGNMVVESYFLKVIVFILGICLASVSLGVILATEIIKFPLESLCLALTQKLNIKLTSVRMRFDVLFMICTLLITLITKNTLYIREGTVISFFLLSRLMGLSYYFFKERLYKGE